MTTIPLCAGISHGTQHFFTGSFAGMTSVIATYPLDLIRTRMAGRLCSGDLCLPYNTWWETAKFTVQNEGVRGLYRGVSPTLIGAFPYEGIKFWSYDYFKARLPKVGPNPTSPPPAPSTLCCCPTTGFRGNPSALKAYGSHHLFAGRSTPTYPPWP